MTKTIFTPSLNSSNSNPFGQSLYKTVNKTVRSMAGKFYTILSDEDIDDLVQDTYIRIIENSSKIDFDKNFAGYVFRTCQNMVNSCALAKSKRNSIILDLDEEFDDEDSPYELDRSSILVDRTYVADRMTLEEEGKEKFWGIIDRLTPSHREVADLLMDETPYDEMAKVLGCSSNALKTRVCRTRQTLSKMGIAA